MAKQISVVEARENLKHCSNQLTSSSKEIDLITAKANLRCLDEESDLPPLVPYIDKGRWTEALSITLAWSLSDEGFKALYPSIRKIISLRIFN